MNDLKHRLVHVSSDLLVAPRALSWETALVHSMRYLEITEQPTKVESSNVKRRIRIIKSVIHLSSLLGPTSSRR
jgi:hypothetical protein